jgi:small neutral amino acid transporter SnatA (MarC family)
MNAMGMSYILTSFIKDIAARRMQLFFRRAALYLFASMSLFAAFLTAMTAGWFALFARLGPVWASLLIAGGFLLVASALIFLAGIFGKASKQMPKPQRPAVIIEDRKLRHSQNIPLPLLLGAALLGVLAGIWGK